MKTKPLKIAIGVILALVAVVLAAYCYISSGHFIKAHVLPRVATALGTEVQAGDVHFSALRSIELKDLRIGSTADPLLQAGTVRLRYHALAFLSGRVQVDEILLDHVQIDATPAKLEALASSKPPAEEKPSKPAKPMKLPKLVMHDIKVQNLSLAYVQSEDGGEGMEFHVPRFDLDLPELASGKNFHLTLATKMKIAVSGQVDADVQEITLDLKGALGADLLPTALNLEANLAAVSGTAGPVSLDGRRLQLVADLAGSSENYEVKQLGLVEYVGDAKDAEMGASGQLGIAPLSAALDLSANIPAGSLLNVIGALAGGLEFGQTAISYKGHVEMASQRNITSRGELSIRDLSVASSSAGIPALHPLQVYASHDIGVDLATQTLTLSQVDAKISDGNRDVVTVKLDKAMAMDLQNPGSDASAKIVVRVDHFDLCMLNPFLAERPDVRVIRGELNRDVTISIENGGRGISLDVGGGGIDNLLVQLGERRVGPLRIDHEARLQLTDFNTLNIKHFKVSLIPLAAGPTPAATVVLDGTLHLGEPPSGQLNAMINGRGEKLAVIAKPFLKDDALVFLQPILSGNIGLDIDSELHAGLDKGVLTLDESHIRVNGFGQDNLVDVSIGKTSFALDDLKQHPEKIVLPIQFDVNDLQLARLLPFVPYESGVVKLAGKVNLNGYAVLAGPAKINLEAQAGIENGMFVLKNGTALASPVTSSLDLALDYTVGGLAEIKRMSAILRQAGRQDPLLHLDVAGHFDTSMDPNVKNELRVSTQDTVQMDALAKLVARPEQTAEAAPQPLPEPVEKQAPPNLWIAFSLAVEKALYGNLLIQDLSTEAEYRNGKVDPAKAVAKINDGSISAEGVCDLGDPAKPKYDMKISGKDLEFAPVLATIIPRTALYTRGGLKSAEIAVRGMGFDMASLQENLVAQVDMQLDQLVIERMSGTAGKLTEALLLGIFNLNWSDLSFTAGGLDLGIDRSRFGDQDIHIQKLLLQAPAFQLDGSGAVQFGGAWAPDMEIKTGFIRAKADSLRRRGYAIATQADDAGYYPGPVIPLKGDLTSLRTQASLVTEVLVRSGKLSAQDAMKADLANQILGSLGGGQANGDKKTDVGGILGGILGVLETQTPQENPTEKKDDPTEAIGNLLQGIFGN